MLLKKREKTYKVCPRCGEKTFVQATVCDNCKLIFARLNYASNKIAKKEIARGARERVIKSSTLPSDLKKWKLFLMCLFGGWFGLHNIYIGKYIKGFFSAVFIILTVIMILLLEGSVLANIFNTFLFIPGAMVVIFWFSDLLLIGIDKYKVPIALDMTNIIEKGKK